MIYRQGDILLKPIRIIPKRAKKKNLILAEGETTGHLHQFIDSVNVTCYELNNQQYIDVINQSDLVHNEHDTLSINIGKYKCVRQREVDLSNEIRRVED